MDSQPKSFPSQRGPFRTVEVHLSDDRTRLIGNCPTCDSPLSIEVREDGTHNRAVSCARCRGHYRIEPTAPRRGTRFSGIGVSYAVEGPWDISTILEFLFDHVGTVECLDGGFICLPDDWGTDFPAIMVDERCRMVRFELFGNHREADAVALIQQTASEFADRFQLDLRPFSLDRWGYRDEECGFAVVERRRLGVLRREHARQGHA